MEKINYRKEIILWVFLLIPMLYLAYVWNSLPDEVPIHFGADGQPNGWGSKASEFIMIGMNVFVYLFLLFFKKIDPKNPGESFFTTNFYKLKLTLVFFISVLSIGVIHAGLPGNALIDGHWLITLAFIFLAVLGNFMINLKPSWFIGIRTPWTLSNDMVWRKTHQVGGRIWFYGGLICAVLTLLMPGEWLKIVLLTFLLGSVAFDYLYSFWLFKQGQGNNEIK